MIPCFYTLAAGGDGLFFFILVVITIVVQVLRLARRSRPQSREETPGDSVFGRGDELGEFLDTLTRGSSAPAPPPSPPPVPPRAVRTRRRAAPAITARPETIETPAPRIRVQQRKAPKTGVKSAAILRALRGNRSLRQAVLLREILGPPTGLGGSPTRSRR